jgi:hypothetical protein
MKLYTSSSITANKADFNKNALQYFSNQEVIATTKSIEELQTALTSDVLKALYTKYDDEFTLKAEIYAETIYNYECIDILICKHDVGTFELLDCLVFNDSPNTSWTKSNVLFI